MEAMKKASASQDVDNIKETGKRSMSKGKRTVSEDDKALFQLQQSAKSLVTSLQFSNPNSLPLSQKWMTLAHTSRQHSVQRPIGNFAELGEP